MAVASDATRVRATKKTDRLTAMETPMSRTLAARTAYSSSSTAGRPNSLTSRAPATLKRSVMRVPTSAFCTICSWARLASRRPISRAGTRKKGTRASAPRVSGQERVAIATMMTTRVMALLTTLDSTEVKACWAPMTSLPRRVTRAPVCARVKNATGWRSTCENTWVRRS